MAEKLEKETKPSVEETTSTPAPGILLVTSDTLIPASLTKEEFDSWYITQHIPLVLTTGKGQIGTATRYQHIPYSSALPSHPLDAPGIAHEQLGFLTRYDLKDVGWVESDAFKGLGKENEGPYRDSVLANAIFDARSYENFAGDEADFDEGQYSEPPPKPPPAPIIITISLSHAPRTNPLSEEDMLSWFEEDHLPYFASISGHRSSHLYRFHKRSLLNRLDASYPGAPSWLVMHEFDGMRVPGIGFRDAEGEMARLKAEIEIGVDSKKGDERERKGEIEFAFWSLMGEYWAKE